ncbi:Fumarylacetoacetate hydrolase domain-containing protein 2 [Madurella mycetomatis]|uniref:Fumarylacetoacetate hydrolase domain-containing protein 2 n=2 Tax=Madurella mycetomatis TaxID=100816 RepID=A0A150ASL6_9PEZI|nr:Fumarylacetoacetate hydrolase domain-containing protein 2 [Madurella mycetomatis]
MSFDRLVRFVPKGDDSKILIGEPADSSIDVGAAVRKGEDVQVKVFSGKSVLDAGSPTGETAVIGRILSPLAQEEVGTIRCIGLNYKRHAEEAKMSIPDIPTLFLKPATCLADPWPAPTIIPKHTIASNTADYESELAVVLGKEAKNVSEADALDYVLGYTASNDISSRASQFAQTQWCYSKGFDGACPLGPVLVSKKLVPDVGKLKMRGLKNGKVVQESGLTDLIFSVAQVVSFLSQGTTLPKGTVIITGTPAGVGFAHKPQELLHDGDEFVVEILPHIGSLYNVMKNED